MSNTIRMEGAQALSFVSIHPIKCGMYFPKVKQLADWANYWDGLQDATNGGNNKIGCKVPVDLADNGRSFLKNLELFIFDGCRELELIVEAQKFVIKKIWGAEGGYVMDYYVHNSREWIKQCRYGYIFKGMCLIEFLEILHERMHSDNWSDFGCSYVNY